jgi:hypothetical protein
VNLVRFHSLFNFVSCMMAMCTLCVFMNILSSCCLLTSPSMFICRMFSTFNFYVLYC